MPLDDETLEILACVKQSYLEAALDELNTNFGGILGYLEAAGISDSAQKALKQRFLINS